MRALARIAAFLACCWVQAAHCEAPAAGSDYPWQLPPGFPRPAVPADNPMSQAKVALGCRLFFDARLSATGTYSCSTCHRPELAFTDGRARAIGATGAELTRGAMTLTNVAYSPAFTWASDRVRSLEAQMEQPLFNEHPVEMGLKREQKALPAALAQDAQYAQAFERAFPDAATPATIANAIKAIAAFERTLISGRSPFDRYVFDDERDALPETAKRGMQLFFSGRAGCSACHSGLNFSGPIAHRGAPQASAAFANNATRSGTAADDIDTGLMAVTGNERDLGRFRVPTLRNVELTAPYMHDGRFATLEAVVEHYAAGGEREPGARHDVDPAIRKLDLTAEEKRELVEFLRSLTDTQFVSGAANVCRAPT
jgi:cytochrome c peroxidase